MGRFGFQTQGVCSLTSYSPLYEATLYQATSVRLSQYM